MSWLYRQAIRPFLFRCDSERIHRRVLDFLGRISRSRAGLNLTRHLYGAERISPVRCFGLEFPNPVGLAAGMDKFAEAVPVWEALGFGFAELGGVTWLEQPGNPAPRMFRVPCDRALINRMGFNNPGAEALARSLRGWRERGFWPAHPVGINLGKSKATPLEQAAEDYEKSFRCLRAWADFFVVNVSSPNTPNLRQLQDKQALDEILDRLQRVNREPLSGSPPAPRPILVKVAPDLSFEALDEILALAEPRGLAGIVATNTTIARPEGVKDEDPSRRSYREQGGMSGAPLRRRSTEVIRHLFKQSRGKVPLIGVGGIFDEDDAWEKVTAGATLVQCYTGLVYEGPGLAARLVRGLRRCMEREGVRDWSEAVGSACR
ncbi:MAG: quinone-dependent dihydroorotate dehydrogenase [Verrucomicrobia bacterium]|nr:quinone-dependent dihydroorotate dehydrogenase [Verrucomicrobiota bacterium]